MRCEDGQWSGHCLMSATIYIQVYEKKVDRKIEKFLRIYMLYFATRNSNISNFSEPFFGPSCHELIPHLHSEQESGWDPVDSWWCIVVLNRIAAPTLSTITPLPLCSQQLYNHFIVRRAGCLVFSNSIYPARVKISISLQCSNLCTWVTTWELWLLYGRK